MSDDTKILTIYDMNFEDWEEIQDLTIKNIEQGVMGSQPVPCTIMAFVDWLNTRNAAFTTEYVEVDQDREVH